MKGKRTLTSIRLLPGFFRAALPINGQACIGLVAVALAAGHLRAIPLWWRPVACSFGVFGFLLLRTCHGRLRLLSDPNNHFKPAL